ncbi:MAG: biotin--[acetyl-CoA-carboxylase] ligase [Myxococcales bacterium FL481]|nr:MAG: biotin--[acetyl-CoA-carboxylase] ligase [Myxococcales bacterium FL481]
MTPCADFGLPVGLRTRRLGRTHEHHAVVSSTNDRAWAWCAEGAPDGALVTADQQTAGRGRRGRTWSSPGGHEDIYASVLVRSLRSAGEGRLSLSNLAGVALVSAVAVREAIVQVGRLDDDRVELKWPNDVLIDRRKVAGILCESRIGANAATLVIGIGCNVQRRSFDAAVEVPATSIVASGGDPRTSRTAVLTSVLEGLEALLEQYAERGFGAVRPRYEPHSAVVGETVRLYGGAGAPRLVVVHRLDDEGRLVVTPVGATETEVVGAGEVSLRVATPAG